MSAKNINYDTDARSSLKKGVDKLANAGRVIGDRLQPGYVPPWYSDSYDPTAGNINLGKSTSFNPTGGILGKLLKWYGNR